MTARLALVLGLLRETTTRKRFLSCFSGVAILLVAGAGQAGVLTSATWIQDIDVYPLSSSYPMNRSTAQLGAAGATTGDDSLAVNLSFPPFATKLFIPKSCCEAVLDIAVSITQGGAQAITAAPSMAGADQGIPGTVVIRTVAHNSKGVNQSSYMSGINTLVKVPINVGVDGRFTGSFIVLGINHLLTVDFYEWTPRRRVFTGLTSKGASLPNVAAQGSFNLTPLGAGTVTLVSPSKVSIDCQLMHRRTASFTSLKLGFAPAQQWNGGGGCGIGPELAALLPLLYGAKRARWRLRQEHA